MNDNEVYSKDILSILLENEDLEIIPCENGIDNTYHKMNLSKMQQTSVNNLMQYIPSAMATQTLAQSYVVKFPNNLPQTLMKLTQGGYSTTIVDGSKIVGTASLVPVASQAMVLGGFTALSMATGQYHLSNITKELKMLSSNIDRILEFLYGDKKAELISEVSFTRYAHSNYMSIMNNETQKNATLINLQQSKKVAMKNIEFYLSDLNSIINSKEIDDLNGLINNAFQIKDSLELSMHLYGMSGLLELYYSQNFDTEYINYIKNDIETYFGKCEKRSMICFSALSMFINNHKNKKWDKNEKFIENKMKVDAFVEDIDATHPMLSVVMDILDKVSTTEYVITKNKEIYIKQ
ncbi:MAG: hypothetical protein R3Y12_04150 [Clostridia bacterium]